MMHIWEQVFPAPTPVIARIGQGLLGALFVISALSKSFRFSGIAAAIASQGIPMSEVVTVAVILFEVIGGAALVVNWRARQAAFALAVFIVPATYLFHAFWMADAAAFWNQLNHFLKNLAIFSALMMVAFSDSSARTAHGGATAAAEADKVPAQRRVSLF